MGVQKSPFLLACSPLSFLVSPLLTPGWSPRAVKAALAGLSGGSSQGGALTSSTVGGRDRPCEGSIRETNWLAPCWHFTSPSLTLTHHGAPRDEGEGDTEIEGEKPENI